MLNVQTIQCTKPKTAFADLAAAQACHASDVKDIGDWNEYTTWVDTQVYTEAYKFMDDKSGYHITRTWPSKEVMDAAEATGGPGFMLDRMSDDTTGWEAGKVSNPPAESIRE
jgi:hypothetical protein